MTRKVLLHVGSPKTGTSHLQDVLFRNQALLREHGILYPADRFDAHFLAALDLMRLPWGGLETEAVGAWERLAAQVRDWPGTSIISHEILAVAAPARAREALDSLGDAEVHLVLSARDLVRQIPAEWQENVKHRSSLTFARFLSQIRDPERDTKIGSWFWGAQEIPDILDRWGSSLPPSRVHVVTVPPPGADREELWRRFSATFELEGLRLDLTAERENPSLGVAETALLRRINAEFATVVAPPDYRPLVREVLAHQTLSHRASAARLALSPQAHAWAQDLAQRWVDEIGRRGYQVVGDLNDLLGGPPPAWTDPDEATAEELLPPAMDAIGALLVEGARLREVETQLHVELEDLREELVRARQTTSHRLRRRTISLLEDSALGRGALEFYRRVRRRL